MIKIQCPNCGQHLELDGQAPPPGTGNGSAANTGRRLGWLWGFVFAAGGFAAGAVLMIWAGSGREMESAAFHWPAPDGYELVLHFKAPDGTEPRHNCYDLDSALRALSAHGWEFAGTVGKDVVVKRRKQDAWTFSDTFERRR